MLFSFEMEKSTPYAPKELEGEYKLVINGRKMRLTKVDDGTKARATCNKTDNWNMVDGINTCLECIKNKKDEAIKVGDAVEIIDDGEVYPYNVDWVVANIKDPIEIARFVNHQEEEGTLNGKHGRVIAVATGRNKDNTMFAYVQMGKVGIIRNYVIDVKALKKI